jgi:hypothetical protein
VVIYSELPYQRVTLPSHGLLVGRCERNINITHAQTLSAIQGNQGLRQAHVEFLNMQEETVGFRFASILVLPRFHIHLFPKTVTFLFNLAHIFMIHLFCSLSYDRSVASSKASSPQGAI